MLYCMLITIIRAHTVSLRYSLSVRIDCVTQQINDISTTMHTHLYYTNFLFVFFSGILSSSLSSLIMNNIINGKRFVCIYIISQFACIQSLVINPVSGFALLFSPLSSFFIFNTAAAAADADHFNFLFEKHFERMGKKSTTTATAAAHSYRKEQRKG